MINVACAVIVDERGSILAVQRSAAMLHAFKWEFPGGKVESGETAEEALQREIREELDIDIELLQALRPTTHAYTSSRVICLIPFLCRIIKGSIKLKEHLEYRWLSPTVMPELDWAEADIPIVQSLFSSPV